MELENASVKYVGPATVKRLAEQGITSVAQLAAMSAADLAAIPGIGENTAPLILASAEEILSQSAAPEVVEVEEMVANAAETMAADVGVDLRVDDIPAEDFIEVAEPAISEKALKKQLKKSVKAEKKAAKKLKKQVKEAKKSVRKAEKKAKKKAKKAAKKAQKDIS